MKRSRTPSATRRQGVSIHPSAEVSPLAKIGPGTKIWHEAQVREYAQIGRACRLGKGVYIDQHVAIGHRVKIQNGVSVYHGVTVEDDVFLGPNVAFMNDPYPRAFVGEWKLRPTRIKRGASIGTNATIVCGITIGEYAMVGAGAVVTVDVPAYGLVIGNPSTLERFICWCGRRVTFQTAVPPKVRLLCQGCGRILELPIEVYSLCREAKGILLEELQAKG